MTDPEDRHLLALGWLLLGLEADGSRFELITAENAVPIVEALAEMLVSVLNYGEYEPKQVVHRWQREHIQRLIDADAHHSEGSA